VGRLAGLIPAPAAPSPAAELIPAPGFSRGGPPPAFAPAAPVPSAAPAAQVVQRVEQHFHGPWGSTDPKALARELARLGRVGQRAALNDGDER
jgi:hypothetical protein